MVCKKRGGASPGPLPPSRKSNWQTHEEITKTIQNISTLVKTLQQRCRAPKKTHTLEGYPQNLQCDMEHPCMNCTNKLRSDLAAVGHSSVTANSTGRECGHVFGGLVVCFQYSTQDSGAHANGYSLCSLQAYANHVNISDTSSIVQH